jgi:monoamine oxidase
MPLAKAEDWTLRGPREFDGRSVAMELRRLGASAEALRLAEILYDAKGLGSVSALFAYRRRLWDRGRGGGSFRISSGNAALSEAFTASLGDSLRLREAVAQIVVADDGVECRCASTRRYRARFALCAIPWSVLQDVVLMPTPAQAAIIRDMPYNKMTRVRFEVRRPFWENDELPATMVSDRPFERLIATAHDSDPSARLTCWINGQQAAKLDDWNPDRIGRFALREIVAARPAAKGQLDLVDVMAWGQDAYVLGSEHAWAPRQITRFGDHARDHWGPVHWIGEHAAAGALGVEGALESAEREVGRLMARMGETSL